MRLEAFLIKHYRSIERVALKIPPNKPLVLFGPNNAGKSNILSAINRLLGERYPTYIEMLESDYFKRNQMNILPHILPLNSLSLYIMIIEEMDMTL